MKICTQLSILALLAVTLANCINKDYSLKEIQNVNTDINFGGTEFGMPIGSLSPISLGSLIKETNLIRLVDGHYELQNQSNQSVAVPHINPISITPSIPSIPASNVSFTKVDINDIDLPIVTIAAAKAVGVTESMAGVNIEKDIAMSHLSNINIGYSFSKELKQVNWVKFGTNSPLGDLLSIAISPDYEGTISNPTTTINSFTITFPYGFELGLPSPNPYAATLSNDNKSITITNKALSGDPITFYVKKVTFNPAVDQTPGNLDYRGHILCDANFKVKGTSSGNIGNINVAFSTTKQLSIQDGQFNTNDISEASLNLRSSLSINEPIGSEEIKSISKITIAKGCKIHLRSAIEGLPSWVPAVNLSDYTIQFPKFLVFKAGQGFTADNKIVINEAISTSAGLSKSYEIEGFAFDAANNPVQNGRIVVSGDVVVSGAFTIPATTNVNSTDINGIEQIKLQPSVSLDQITVETVKGIIDPKIEINPINIEIELGSDMSFIENSTLDLTQAAIQIVATNPVGLSAEIGVTINTYDQLGAKITTITQPTGIVVLPSETSNIWLSNTTNGMPEDFTFVSNATLPSIFKKLPSRLEVLLTANTNKYESEINIANQSTDPLEFVCNIIAPLNVGSAFELAYSDRLKDLHASIGDYLKYASKLILNVNTKNNIPLNLTLAAKPFDKNGVEIQGLKMSVEGLVGAGTKDGAFTDSDVALTIIENVKGELAKLDQIEISFKGNASQALAGAPLKPDQTIKVKMSAKIPGGITIKQ